MIWHVVRFEFDGVAEADRRDVEASLAGLAEIAQVAWLRVARDLDQPAVTGLLTAFETVEDLETYRTHPDHVPVVERIRDLGVGATRFDIDVAGGPDTLP